MEEEAAEEDDEVEGCTGVVVRCNSVRSCKGILRRLQMMAAAASDDEEEEDID